MPTFKCRQCPQREFNSRTALYQHYRTTAGHPFCNECNKLFHNDEGLEAHIATDHPQFFCTTCQQSFLTQASLDDHYRGKASTVHPNCPRCGKGFFNTRTVDEHFKEAHPTENCVCGRRIYVEDLPRHYTDSIEHPTCLLCTIGFKDDAAYSAHCVAEHPEYRCTLCTRQFHTKDELKAHLNTSDLHPKCTQCKFGFMDDGALDEHLVAEHLSLETAFPKPSKDLLAIEGPPANTRRSKASDLPPPGWEANAMWASTKNQVVPAPFAMEPWVSSTALISVRPRPLPDNVSPGGFSLSKSSVRGIEAPPARLFERAKTAADQNLVQRPQVAFRPLGETPMRNEQVESYQSLSSRTVVTTPVPSFKTISPQSSNSSFSTASFTELSDSSSNSNNGSKGTVVPGVGVRCMVCRGRCMEPMATMCGHVFCKNCITKRVMQTPACPRCDAPTLLYSLFRLHLDV
ncbi:hypothetical protein B0H14DRAFT_1367337 [Mycena olivaceomarginata]|nr:hypothetical protein B0H14DRAFT_1367337 [Mycena olivaceomarginata]